MKVILFVLVFLNCTCFAFGQNEYALFYTDSLIRQAEKTTSDSLKILSYFQLSDFWSDRDTAKAFIFLRQAKQHMPVKNDYYQGLYHFYNAGIYFDRDIDKGLKEYLEAEKYLKRYSSKPAYTYRAKLWNNYGALLQRRDKQEEYIDILLHYAIPFSQKAGDSILVANNYQNVAMILMNITDYEKADVYYENAINSLSLFPNANEEKLTAYVNAAKNSIYNRDFQKAKRHLENAKDQLFQIPHSLYAPAFHSASGMFFRHQDEMDSALYHFDTALQLAGVYQDQRMESAILFEKYNVYKKMRNFRAAKEILLEALETITNLHSRHDRRLHLKELAYTDSQLGNFQAAFDWLNQYVILTDSVFEEDSEMRILELERKYQSVEKENEILKLKGQNQQQKLEIEENKFMIVLLLSIALIGFLLSFIALKSYRSKKRTIAQNLLLHDQELKSFHQKERIKVYNAMLQGQEQERNRIARDLHDGLGGMLSGVKLKLSSIVSKERYDLNQPNMEIYNVIQQLDKSVAELRRIARNMMPESLIYMGLKPALRDLCKSLNSDETAVVFEAYDLRDQHEQSLQISVYRIVQELLTNALKHAEAKNIVVQCSENQDILYITVEDDGKGFEYTEEDHKRGIGLMNIQNRVQLLQGSLEIASKIGVGTTCNIEIPLNGK